MTWRNIIMCRTLATWHPIKLHTVIPSTRWQDNVPHGSNSHSSQYKHKWIRKKQLWLVRCHNTGTKYYAGISTTAITQQHMSIIWHLASHNIYVHTTQTITCTEITTCTNKQSIHRQQTSPPMPLCAHCHVCMIWKHRQTDRLKAVREWLQLLTTSSVANVHLYLIAYRFTIQTCYLHLKHDKTDGQTEFDNYVVKMYTITDILTGNVSGFDQSTLGWWPASYGNSV